jgi:hypothetical protein
VIYEGSSGQLLRLEVSYVDDREQEPIYQLAHPNTGERYYDSEHNEESGGWFKSSELKDDSA